MFLHFFFLLCAFLDIFFVRIYLDYPSVRSFGFSLCTPVDVTFYRDLSGVGWAVGEIFIECRPRTNRKGFEGNVYVFYVLCVSVMLSYALCSLHFFVFLRGCILSVISFWFPLAVTLIACDFCFSWNSSSLFCVLFLVSIPGCLDIALHVFGT